MPRYIDWYDLEIKLEKAVKNKLITREEFNSVKHERDRMTEHNGDLIPFNLDLNEIEFYKPDEEDGDDQELWDEYNTTRSCCETLHKLGYKGKTLEVYWSW